MTATETVTTGAGGGAAAAPPAVALTDLRRRFGATVAVDGLSLEVADGELLAMVGPSGCGKSTVLRLVAGLLPADGGEIRIRGELVTGPGMFVQPERRHVGIVFQDPALFPHLRVAGNVAFGLRGRPAAAVRARVRAVLELVELPDHAERFPHELSGGERQRVALARALAPDPAVILLDEPFSSLDHNLRTQIRGEVVAILRRAGTSAIFVTHDQREALAVGDRVAVLRAGKLEQLDRPEVVFHAPVNRFVASFMGEADFLPARAGADGQLVTEAGPCPCPDPALEGDGLEVMVRPHEVAFAPDPEGGARVVRAEFQGGFVLHELELASGRRLRSLQPHNVSVPPGTRVSVRLVHEHAPAVLRGGGTSG